MGEFDDMLDKANEALEASITTDANDFLPDLKAIVRDYVEEQSNGSD